MTTPIDVHFQDFASAAAFRKAGGTKDAPIIRAIFVDRDIEFAVPLHSTVPQKPRLAVGPQPQFVRTVCEGGALAKQGDEFLAIDEQDFLSNYERVDEAGNAICRLDIPLKEQRAAAATADSSKHLADIEQRVQLQNIRSKEDEVSRAEFNRDSR
jgi:hypothetical protein